MKINIKKLKTWINALRSGEYKQIKKTLQTYKGYCCLGVACKLFIPEGKQEVNFYGKLAGDEPDDQRNAPEWLKDINREFRDKTGKYLTALNDIDGFSFNEIADVLEMVYILRVLD
jgi:hypothetical protein